MPKIPLLFFALFIATISSSAQQIQLPELTIHFRIGSSDIDLNYMDNRVALSRVTAALNSQSAPYINSIRIEGYASLDGGYIVNDRLARERAESLKRYIMANSSNHIDPAKISSENIGMDWKQLRSLADADYKLPRRSEVLYIIDNVDARVNVKANTSRKKSLMDLGVKTWYYMYTNYFPLLRTGKAIIIVVEPGTPEEMTHSIGNILNGIEDQHMAIPVAADTLNVEKVAEKVAEKEAEKATEKVTEKVSEKVAEKVTEKIAEKFTEKVVEKIDEKVTEKVAEKVSEKAVEKIEEKVAEKTIEKVTEKIDEKATGKIAEKEAKKATEKVTEKEIGISYGEERKPLFAVKTNLLFDVLSALNVEIEVPIGKRWSVAGEYVFPWWLWEEKQIAFEMLNLNIEGRYWLGSRADKKEMTGWYMGLYAGGGYFDFEWKKRGYQGEFFIATGLSAGYAHTIGKSGNWRMEYGIGVGYLHTNYREYVPKFGSDGEWHLIRQRSGNYTWMGPTKAKVSLVWMINGKKKKGGAR